MKKLNEFIINKINHYGSKKVRTIIVHCGNAATSFVAVWMQANTRIMCW